MTALLVGTLSAPCSGGRHQRCQLGALCVCDCHAQPVLAVVPEPDVSLRDALCEWLLDVEGEIIVAVEAHKFVQHLRATNPDQLQAWLDEHAELLIGDLLADVARDMPPRNRERSMFADRAADFANGNREAFTHMDLVYVVDDNQTRLRLRDMHYSDFAFPIERLEKFAKIQLMQAAYLRAVRKRVPCDDSRAVGEVLTEEKLDALREVAV